MTPALSVAAWVVSSTMFPRSAPLRKVRRGEPQRNVWFPSFPEILTRCEDLLHSICSRPPGRPICGGVMSDEIRLDNVSAIDSPLSHFMARAAGPLIEGDEFFRAVVDALPAAIYTTDPSGRITYYNEAAAALWGCRPELGKSEWCGSWRLFWPDGRVLPHDQCPMAIAVRELQAIRGMEAVAERPDGTRVPFLPFPVPIFNTSGVLIGAVNMLVDITERKRAEEATQRLASIVDSSDDAIISKDLDGIITSWNKGAERIFGYVAEEVIGKPVTILIPQDRQDEEPFILQRIRRGERVDYYETVRRRKDGSLIDISLSVSAVRDMYGKIMGASKIARDITERKRREAQIFILAREAEHRSKNVLAAVQATVQLSQSDTPDGLKQAIQGRIRALANVHALFVEARWSGAHVRDLVTQELSPYCQGAETRAHIEGPHLLLEPYAAQTIGVTLHELATNAAKYGALSIPDGRIHVAWSAAENERLILRWTEAGGPLVAAPTRKGFGTRMIERMIRDQLKGTMHFDWHADGLACEIVLPLQ
jgi:PAS domain S-box-containing protein